MPHKHYIYALHIHHINAANAPHKHRINTKLTLHKHITPTETPQNHRKMKFFARNPLAFHKIKCYTEQDDNKLLEWSGH